jgi:hypothetical protein
MGNVNRDFSQRDHDATEQQQHHQQETKSLKQKNKKTTTTTTTTITTITTPPTGNKKLKTKEQKDTGCLCCLDQITYHLLLLHISFKCSKKTFYRKLFWGKMSRTKVFLPLPLWIYISFNVYT